MIKYIAHNDMFLKVVNVLTVIAWIFLSVSQIYNRSFQQNSKGRCQ